MTITYNLTVGDLATEYYDDSITEQAITNISWQLIGTSVDAEGTELTSQPAWGTVELLPPGAEDYVPYASLTGTQLTEWVQNRLESLDGPDNYSSLWDYLTQKRIDDINFLIQNQLEPDPEPVEEEDSTPVKETL